MLIKDPLQSDPSPYHVLDVPPTADAKAINQAMGRAIMDKKFNAKTVQNARQVLLKPESRALVNLLMYPADAIAKETDLGSAESLPLSLDVRRDTARTWRGALVDRFPDNTLLHALALIWYWWGEYEGERHLAIVRRLDQAGVSCYRVTRKDTLLKKIAEVEDCGYSPGSGCPREDCPWHADCQHQSLSLQDIWEKVIAFMTPILSSPDTWPEIAKVSGADTRDVRQDLRERVEGTVSKLSTGFSQASATALANTADQLLLDFETERKTGQLMTKIRITYKKSKKSYTLGTGRFLLRELNELSGTRRAVDHALEKGEGSSSFLSNLRELQYLLSPFANIYHQIDRKRWAQALEIIDSLSASEARDTLVQKMTARAHIGMGRQEFEISNVESALSHWKKAKNIPAGKSDWEEEVPQIQQTILNRVAKIEGPKPDAAIRLLEGADDLLEDNPDIRARLSSVLTRTSIHRIVQIQKKAEKQKPTREDVARVKEGVERLEKAAQMGSERAQDQLEPAKVFLVNLVMMTGADVDVDLPDGAVPHRAADPALKEVDRLRREAAQAAKEKAWEKAAQKLRQALKELPAEAPTQLKDTLEEECRITENNAAMQWREKAGSQAKKNGWGKAVDLLDKAHTLLNQSPVGGHSGLNKQIEKELSICLTQSAIASVNAVLEMFKSGDFSDISLLKAILESSEKMLVRARKLDPGNSQITRNLDEVRKLMDQFGAVPSRTTTPRSKPKDAAQVRTAWIVNIALLAAGLVLTILNVSPLVQLVGGLAVIGIAAGSALIGLRPGLGLAYTGALLAAAAYLLSLFE
jgi:hypothetical protein